MYLNLTTQDGLPDEADDFDDFRVRSIDLVKDVEFVVGATNIVVQVGESTFDLNTMEFRS